MVKTLGTLHWDKPFQCSLFHWLYKSVGPDREGEGRCTSAGSSGFLSYHTPVQDEARGQPRGDKVSWLFAVWPRGGAQAGRSVSLSYPPFSMIVSCTPRRSLYNTLTRRSYTLHTV